LCQENSAIPANHSPKSGFPISNATVALGLRYAVHVSFFQIIVKDLPTTSVSISAAENHTSARNVMTKFIYKNNVTGRTPVRTWTDSPANRGAFSLLQATETIARTATHRLPCHGAPRNLDRSFQPRMMLFLLSYCYARQIYKSTDIEKLVLTDGLMRRCCGDEAPTAADLRRFRSEHREALLFCLTSALRGLADYDLAAGLITKVDEARIAADAKRRIITAMFADSMEAGAQPTTDEAAELSYLFAKQLPPRH
jgi:hypothetical protein